VSELTASFRQVNQTAMEVIRRQGVQFLTPAPGEVEQYKQISARAMAREGGHKFSEKVREEVLRLLADFRGGSK
jgi:hypothetical protein